jgi:hypothetical protein
MLIQASILGAMADLNQWRQFSCINPDGTLNSLKFAEFMRLFANLGANATRELPFLVPDGHYTGKVKQRNFLPWVWRNGAYDLRHFNPVYFENLKDMIKIAHRHGLAFQFSIFDRCHGANMPDSPWNLNRNNIHGYYDWNQFARRWVEKVIQTVYKAGQEMWEERVELCDVFFELENEPMEKAFVKVSIETLRMLLNAGFKKDQVEDGVAYLPHVRGVPIIKLKGRELVRSPLFELQKKTKRRAGLYLAAEDKKPVKGDPNSTKDDKALYFSTIHKMGLNPDVLEEMKVALGHTRRLSLSCDGEKPKPSAAEWRRRLKPLFESATRGRGNRKIRLENWKFEHIYRGGLDGRSMFGDAMDGVLGISEAYRDVFGHWPENFGRFPEVILPPEPVTVPVEPPTLQQQIDELRLQVEQNMMDIEMLKQQN